MEKVINFELRGDEQELIEEIKKYIPADREDIWSWLCYFQGELKENEHNESDWFIDEETAQKLIDLEPIKVPKSKIKSAECSWTKEEWDKFKSVIIKQYENK